MKITIGINTGDRVRYLLRKGWTGRVLSITNHSCLIEWDEVHEVLPGSMWVSTRHLRRISIIGSIVADYRAKVKSAIVKVRKLIP